MDIQVICNVLTATLSPDEGVRKAAEATLLQVNGFLVKISNHLLEYIKENQIV